VEEGEITLCYTVPLIIVSTSPTAPDHKKIKQKQKQTIPRADQQKNPGGLSSCGVLPR
jgi:hypothetical protein